MIYDIEKFDDWFERQEPIQSDHYPYNTDIVQIMREARRAYHAGIKAGLSCAKSGGVINTMTKLTDEQRDALRADLWKVVHEAEGRQSPAYQHQ